MFRRVSEQAPVQGFGFIEKALLMQTRSGLQALVQWVRRIGKAGLHEDQFGYRMDNDCLAKPYSDAGTAGKSKEAR